MERRGSSGLAAPSTSQGNSEGVTFCPRRPSVQNVLWLDVSAKASSVEHSRSRTCKCTEVLGVQEWCGQH